MKISPISNAAPVTTPDGGLAAARTLKMNTNATTPPAGPEAAQELSILPINEEKPNPAIEATEPISPQFAALAKQRRALQQERRAFIDERKAFEIAKQGSDAITKDRIKSEPLSVLLEAGVTYEQLTQDILANQGNPEVVALRNEITALKEGVDKKFTDSQTQAEEEALAEMGREATRIIATNDDFELVRATESVPKVLELIARTYKETKEVLDVTDALKLIEDELFAREQKLVTTKKLQSLFKPAEQPPQVQQRTQGMRTLTNKDTASVPMNAKQRALAAFYGTLKK